MPPPEAFGGGADESFDDPVAATYPAGDPYADDPLHGDLHGDVDADGDGIPDGIDDGDPFDEPASPFEFDANEFRPGGLFGHDSG